MSTLNKGYTRIAGTDAINTIDNTNDTQLTEIEADMTTIESHIDDTSNPHGVTRAQVGLSNVDNTSDVNKPISTATQTALNAKVSADSPTLITPVLGDATATTINKITITQPASSGVLTIANGKTPTVPLDASVSGTNTGDQTDRTLTFTDNTTNDASDSMHGFCPKLPGIQSQYLRGDGTWGVSAGGGNVVGPGSAISNNPVLFDGTSGTLIKDGDGYSGWIATSETWTYSSVDAPSYVFTISGDKTTKYSAGMKVRLTDAAATKYFIITKVAYGAPNTSVTVYGGTDYTLAGGAITNPCYSIQKSPFGFPLNPTKWTVEVTDVTQRSQVNPTQKYMV